MGLTDRLPGPLGGVFATARRAWHNPRLVGRALNRSYYQFRGGEFNDGGVDVFDADWDILVILDACRYDLFEAVSDLPGDLERRESKAGNTVGFLRANVAGRDLRDTVYVSANPQFRKLEDELNAPGASPHRCIAVPSSTDSVPTGIQETLDGPGDISGEDRTVTRSIPIVGVAR